MRTSVETSNNSDHDINNSAKRLVDFFSSKEAVRYIEQKLKNQGKNLLGLFARVTDIGVINSMLTNPFLPSPLRKAVIAIFSAPYRSLSTESDGENQFHPIPSKEANQFIERVIFQLNNNLTSGANIENQLQFRNRSLFEYCLKLSDPRVIAGMFKCIPLGNMFNPTERQILIGQFHDIYKNIRGSQPSPIPTTKRLLSPKQANELLAAIFAESSLETAVDKVRNKLIGCNLFDICSKANDPSLIRKVFLGENHALWTRLTSQEQHALCGIHRDIYQTLQREQNRQHRDNTSQHQQRSSQQPNFALFNETKANEFLAAIFAEPSLEKAVEKVQNNLRGISLFDICSKANDPALVRKMFLGENRVLWARLTPLEQHALCGIHREIYQKLLREQNQQQRDNTSHQQDITEPPFKMGEDTDPYAILDLDAAELSAMTSEDADQKITAAYKKMALKHHPDRNLGDEEAANERMKKVTGAKDFLGKPENREAWKNWNNAQQSESPRPRF